ncbi:MAG: c-type cytochrome biogenesis protein CcmI [Pseudomonadota bacterium]
MFVVYAIGLGLGVAVLALLLAPLMISDRRANDADVYRNQLASLDKDLARGVVTQSEYDGLRAEIARRLLATQSTPAPETEASARKRTGMIAVVGAVCVGTAIYWSVGAPGQPDAPLALRVAQADQALRNLPDQSVLDAPRPEFVATGVDQAYRDQMQALRLALVDRPTDLRGFTLLARGESRLGDFPAAHKAQRRVLDIKGDFATAEDWGLYTEFLLLAGQERFSDQSQSALLETLRRNPTAGLARYRLGQLHLQTGRPDRAFSIWADLLDQGPEAAPFVPAIRAQIDQVASSAGFPNYEQPRPRGPDLDAINDAQDMTDEDRAAMIQGMVAGLADRLATDSGPVQDWAQLIRALGVLGQLDQAQAVYEDARAAFQGRPAELRLLDQTAIEAGVIE